MVEKITTEQQFLEKVSGRKLTRDDSWVVISPGGTVEGQGPRGRPISGKWTWEDGYYCRTIVFDDDPLPEDFQAVTLDGDTVTFAHEKGQGVSVSWALKQP